MMHYALLVGVDQYTDDRFVNLRWPSSDARKLKQRLVGHPVGPFTDDTISVLVDGEGDSSGTPSRLKILEALTAMCDSATEGDLALFYFAGHGLECNKKPTLIVKDSKFDILPDTGLEVENLLRIMNGSRASHRVMFIDACREPADDDVGRAAKESSAVAARGFGGAFERTINAQEAFGGWEVGSACASGQMASESTSLGGGVWTVSLIAVIDELLDRQEPVTVDTLLSLAHARVVAWAKGNNRNQIPFYRRDAANSAILLSSPPANKAAGPPDPLAELVRKFQVRILQRGNPARLRAVDECWDRDFASVHLVPFHSTVNRNDRPSRPAELRIRNTDFALRLYLPPLTRNSPPYDRLYLFFNGIGEVHPGIYDDIGLDLAERKGVPAAFVPLPLHFCRHYEFPSEAHDQYLPRRGDERTLMIQRELRSVMTEPRRIINSIHQVIADAKGLCDLIEARQHGYWSYLFVGRPSISLLGYSLGGFSALALTLLDPNRYSAVFLLESGGSVDQINPAQIFHRPESTQRLLWRTYYVAGRAVCYDEPLFSVREADRARAFDIALNCPSENRTEADVISDGDNVLFDPGFRVFDRDKLESLETWRDIIEMLYKEIDAKESPLSNIEREKFKRIWLGYERASYNRELAALSDKLLVITGGADEVFPTRMLLDMGPDTGLALLQIPGFSHWIKTRSRQVWLKWQMVIVDLMETFQEALWRDIGETEETDR